MHIDLDMLLRVMTLVFAVGSTLYAYASQRDKATSAQINALEKKVGTLETQHAQVPDFRTYEARVQKLEADLQHVPDKDTLHRLELSMQTVRSEVEGMKDQWTTALRSIQRLEEYLLSTPPLAPAEPARRKAARK
ncbi:MAG: DUF2730 family protein [Hyphomicrobium sp.]